MTVEAILPYALLGLAVMIFLTLGVIIAIMITLLVKLWREQ